MNTRVQRQAQAVVARSPSVIAEPLGLLQRAAVNSTSANQVPTIVHDALRSPGQPLDADTRAFMEPRFGHDFARVPVSAGATPPVQTQLAISQPDDAYEREADRTAQTVMRAAEAGPRTSGPDFSAVRIHADAGAAD